MNTNTASTNSSNLSQNEIKSIIYKLHPLARKSLQYLMENNVTKQEVPQEILDGAYFLEQEHLITLSIQSIEYIELDSLGLKFLEEELPEYQILQEIVNTSKTISQINLSQEVVNSAFGELKKLKLIEISKNENNELILTSTSKAQEYIDLYTNPLIEFKEPVISSQLNEDQKLAYNSLQKRKSFLKKSIQKSTKILLTHRGEEVGKELMKNFKDLELLETVTSQMLTKSSYKDKEFRHYDVTIPTTIKEVGRYHPMLEANDILTQIFVELGFKEMEGPIVESEFWCFDALWIPQDHPAREDQDTFYIGNVADVDQELIESIRTMHEEGIDESHTQKGDFKESITKNTILRTHSTATSFRTLHELGLKQEKGENIDGKYFYVAHNFRNEAVDATHLAEFFQAEGILIADDLSLAGLIGFMKEFYSKLGLTNLKFKPTFNPYTEPSMEIHYFDPQMDKWYSIGNSGIFRPEVLRPFGLENKRIYGFGLGASRVATLLTQKNNMREITGATCDLNWIQNHTQLKRNILR